MMIARPLQSEALAYKGPTDEPQASLPFDMAPVAHSSHRPSFGIDQWRQTVGIRTLTGPIDFCRRALSQGLVRSVVIVARQPAIRTPLHESPLRATLGHDLPLVTAVKLLVARVVARARPPGELDADAQPQPPDRQPRQPQCARAREGRPVVHPDDPRQTPLAKQALEDLAHAR